MDAMQYDLTLPADYDMGIIRHRVTSRGSGTDAFPGLGIKAYGIREKGVTGSPVNQYAPFYLWADPAGLKQFLFGPPFAGLSADFGRPPVRHWSGLAFTPGAAVDGIPASATRFTTRIESGADLPDVVEEAIAQLPSGPGVHSSALVADLATWELLRFTLWTTDSPDGPGDRYEVLHTSSPHLRDLKPSRQW